MERDVPAMAAPILISFSRSVVSDPCSNSCNNAVRLQLHALVYNLGTFMRTLALPKEVEHRSLTTLRA